MSRRGTSEGESRKRVGFEIQSQRTEEGKRITGEELTLERKELSFL